MYFLYSWEKKQYLKQYKIDHYETGVGKNTEDNR